MLIQTVLNMFVLLNIFRLEVTNILLVSSAGLTTQW